MAKKKVSRRTYLARARKVKSELDHVMQIMPKDYRKSFDDWWDENLDKKRKDPFPLPLSLADGIITEKYARQGLSKENLMGIAGILNLSVALLPEPFRLSLVKAVMVETKKNPKLMSSFLRELSLKKFMLPRGKKPLAIHNKVERVKRKHRNWTWRQIGEAVYGPEKWGRLSHSEQKVRARKLSAQYASRQYKRRQIEKKQGTMMAKSR